MDFQDIQEKINAMLEGDSRQLVFWYDDDGSYEENIKEIQLATGCKIWIVTQDNWFATKLQIEERDPQTSYLIYAPFGRPDDRENVLADIFYYSQHFYSDKLIQIMGDIGIPVECLDEVKRYKKFWTSGNISKFVAIGNDDYTPQSVVLGILCVLGGAKTLSFEELLRQVVLAGLEDNPVLKKMDFYKITGSFWSLCEKQYGYKDPTPSLKELLCTMMVTYMDTVTGGRIPAEWKTFLSARRNDDVVFIKNLMNNDESRAVYDDFADQAEIELNVANMISRLSLDDLVECDAMKAFDENLISWIITKIEDSMLDEKVAGLSIPEICEERIKPCYHFADTFKSRYLMLMHAYLVIREASLDLALTTINEGVKSYTDRWYQIDRNYRKFYFYMDMVGLTEETEKIRDLVENIYTNKYLANLSYKWNQLLTDEIYKDFSGSRQDNFYVDHVRPFMREDGREGRVIVIISDGMRYECGRELFENLELDEKCSAKMFHALSVLPSETTLGMAALLPHKEIEVDSDLNITVDGLNCGNSMTDREKVLKKYVPRSACYDFDKLMTAKTAELRSMLQDKDVVYVYQNQIDQRGEGGRSESEVFNACEEAVQEIQTLIHRLTGYVSATRYLITADHGFIYKRDRLQESDKISLDKSMIPKTNYRYLLSDAKIQGNALVSRCLAYLSALNRTFVTTPVGADIIKKQAGGMNYVHGGSSLQEMMIPVIKVKTVTGRMDTGLVNVEISSFMSRITNIEFKLDFMQMEPVTDKLKPRRLIAFFVDSENHKISFDVPIIANSREKDSSKRIMNEKFTLKSDHYRRDQDYFLILADMADETKIYQKYKFAIDIADL